MLERVNTPHEIPFPFQDAVTDRVGHGDPEADGLERERWQRQLEHSETVASGQTPLLVTGQSLGDLDPAQAGVQRTLRLLGEKLHDLRFFLPTNLGVVVGVHRDDAGTARLDIEGPDQVLLTEVQIDRPAVRLVEGAHGVDGADHAGGVFIHDGVRRADRAQRDVALRAAAQRVPALASRVPRQEPLALQLLDQREQGAVQLAVAW